MKQQIIELFYVQKWSYETINIEDRDLKIGQPKEIEEKAIIDILDILAEEGITIQVLADTALELIFTISNTFNGLIISQMVLSVQLPITIFLQIHLTSSEKVMGIYKNKLGTTTLLNIIGAIVMILNILLFASFFGFKV